MNPIRFLTMTLLVALFPPLLQAHAKLTQTQPTAGAVLEQAPAALELNFNEAVYLVEVTLLDGRQQSVDIGFSAPKQAAETFSITLPALPDDRYTVQWTAVGEDDDHTVLGDISFGVGAAQAAFFDSGNNQPRGEEHDEHHEHEHHE